ncbi:MAG: DUF4159 domain-containing protein [SAR324 cluster bacterium]|nr:DUF4159 domain-containing protein [SAR324 cluster bacterium]
MFKNLKWYGALILWMVLVCNPLQAEEESMLSGSFRDPNYGSPGEPEFVMIRGKYTNYPGGRRRGPGWGRYWWETDFDDAEQNLLKGVLRYTNVDTSSTSYKALSLTDPELFEYSFVYINMKRVPLYGGYGPDFKPEEAKVLREYMLRGGFVMLDDFWGPEHWNDFLIELAKIFPDRELHQLETRHPIFHSFFDIDKIVQVPGRGVTWNFGAGFFLDNPDYPTAVHGVFDDQGRLMLLVNFNTDLGDGWEHTFDPVYPTRYCNEAYKLGINYIVYAMSH